MPPSTNAAHRHGAARVELAVGHQRRAGRQHGEQLRRIIHLSQAWVGREAAAAA
jgi:hypothetical protein